MGAYVMFLYSNFHSCIDIYALSCLKLLLNRPEAVFKQQSPCLNHKIRLPFEHDFLLKILEKGLRFVA